MIFENNYISIDQTKDIPSAIVHLSIGKIWYSTNVNCRDRPKPYKEICSKLTALDEKNGYKDKPDGLILILDIRIFKAPHISHDTVWIL